MAAVHTDSAAIFGGQLINEAEEFIKFIPYRPVGQFDSKTDVTFTIPGNSSQYVSLRDTYLMVLCHMEETDAAGKVVTAPPVPSGLRPSVKTHSEILELQKEAETRYNSYEQAKNEQNAYTGDDTEEKSRLETHTVSMEEFAIRSMKSYLSEKHNHRQVEGLTGSILPIDNVLHSMWNGVDVTMNHKLVSSTNQKYMYKAYIETLLNNSASTKRYQLGSHGFYGDGTLKDTDFNLSYGEAMEKRYMDFSHGKKVLLQGHLLSDVMGIQASIVNGVEISITLHPNPDAVRVHCFGSKNYGALVIDDIYLMVCKRGMTKEVVVAHSDVLEMEPARYAFKESETNAYNGHKGQMLVTIENPYQKKIPTRLVVAMVDADAHKGNYKLTPLNFQHYNLCHASFQIDNETIAKPPYNIDVKERRVVEPLMELYSIMGKMGEDRDIGITVDEFLDGTFLLPFDVTPTASANMEYLAKKQGGNCTLQLQFDTPLPKNVIILTYGIFPAELHIDNARNCTVQRYPML